MDVIILHIARPYLEQGGRDIHGKRVSQNVVHVIMMMRMSSVHDHELHVLRRLPMAFPLVDEPVVYLLLIQSRRFC